VIVESALSTPANGPELNPTDSESGRAGKDDGTRTEAAQKVPQAKPECAVASVRPAAASVIAAVPESPAGFAGVPR
jgi:hypothetical protein